MHTYIHIHTYICVYIFKCSPVSLLTLKVSYSDLCPALSTDSYKKYDFPNIILKTIDSVEKKMSNLIIPFTFSPSYPH